MIKNFWVLILAMTSFVSYGQKKSIDIKEIKNLANTDSYDKLFDKFIANDTTLTLNEYITIYYGQAFKDNFKPNASHDSLSVLNKYINSNKDSLDFHKILSYNNMILKDFPFDIGQIYINGIAYERLGMQDSSDIWFYKYSKLIRTIMASGDGKTAKTAFIVVKIADEYSILKALGLKFTGQSLKNEKKKNYDVLNVTENKYEIDKLYFDINLFFGKW